MNKLFGRRKRTKPGKTKRPRKLPERKLAPVAEIVEQGILVANVAARMSVKNTIIMNALSKNVDYDVAQVQDLVRDKLLELSHERLRDANHIKRVREEIRKYGRSAWQETEYGSDDNRTLKHRQEVYEQLAAMMQKEAADEKFVSRTAKEARDQAWLEIGDSLKERASHPYYSGGATPEYRREREGRIKDLIDGDLAKLIKGKPKRTNR